MPLPCRLLLVPIVIEQVAALNGFNTCILCYGQTGSGKTHAAFGPPGCLEGKLGPSAALGNDGDGDNVAGALIRPDSGLVVRAIAEVIAGAAFMARGQGAERSGVALLNELGDGGGGASASDPVSAAVCECGAVTTRLSAQCVWKIRYQQQQQHHQQQQEQQQQQQQQCCPLFLRAEHLPACAITAHSRYVEIYNNECVDLLTGNPCDVRRSSAPGAVHRCSCAWTCAWTCAYATPSHKMRGPARFPTRSSIGAGESNLAGAVECPLSSLAEAVRLLRAGQVVVRGTRTIYFSQGRGRSGGCGPFRFTRLVQLRPGSTCVRVC